MDLSNRVRRPTTAPRGGRPVQTLRFASWLLYGATSLLFGVALLSSTAVGQDSSAVTESAARLLTVRTASPAEELLERTRASARQLAEMLRELGDKKLLVADIAKLNEVHQVASKLRQAGELLLDAREVAGADLMARGNEAVQSLEKWAAAIRTQPDFSKIQGRVTKEFISETKAREKKLNRVRSLVKQAKWDEADKAYGELWDPIAAGKLWVDSSVFEGAERLFERDNRDLREGLRTQFRQQVEESLASIPGKTAPDLRGFAQSVEQAVAGLRSGETSEFRGQTVTGPGLLAEVSRSLQTLQSEVIRHEVVRLYERGQRDSEVEQVFDVTRAEFGKWAADVVRSDVSRLTRDAAAARARYLEYLTVLAPLSAQAAEAARAEELEAALTPFLSVGGLKGELTGYRLATDPLLDWRERTAQAQAQAAREGFTPFDMAYTEASSQLKSEGTEEPGGSPLKWSSKPNVLQDPLDRLLPLLGARLSDRRVVVSRVLRRADQPDQSLSPLTKGVYAELPTTPVPPEVIARLERDLLVGPERPALSLRAAAALWSLKHGAVLEVGGRTNSVELEAPGPRWLTVEPGDAAFVTPAPLVTTQVTEFDRQVLARVRVQPVWYRYRHHFLAGP